MTFDASKTSDVEKMSSADFGVWRTSKQNEVSSTCNHLQITYSEFRSLRTLPEPLSITPQGP